MPKRDETRAGGVETMPRGFRWHNRRGDRHAIRANRTALCGLASPRAGAGAGGAVDRPDSGRSRRAGHQGRIARGRRDPPLGAAVPHECRRLGGGCRVLPLLQPRQGIPRAGLPQGPGSRARRAARVRGRRAHRELQGGRPREARSRLREPVTTQSGPGVLLDQRLRAGRALRRPAGLRLRGPGHERADGRDGRPGQSAAESRRCRLRHHHRPLWPHRYPGGAGRARPLRARAACRGRTARFHDRHSRQPGDESSHRQPDTGAHGQRASQHRPLSGIPHGGRIHRRRGGQRPAIPLPVRSSGVRAAGGRSAIRHQRRPRAQSRGVGSGSRAASGGATPRGCAGSARGRPGAVRARSTPWPRRSAIPTPGSVGWCSPVPRKVTATHRFRDWRHRSASRGRRATCRDQRPVWAVPTALSGRSGPTPRHRPPRPRPVFG